MARRRSPTTRTPRPAPHTQDAPDTIAPCIGGLETSSAAAGFLAADAIAKGASVRLLRCGLTAPGRHLTLIDGEVDAVFASIAAGRDAAGAHVHASFVIPSIEPSVITAIASPVLPGDPSLPDADEPLDAVGLLETDGVAAAIASADAAAKSGSVVLLRLRIGEPILTGRALLMVTGAIDDVDSALAAGQAVANQRGSFVHSVVIPRPDRALRDALVADDARRFTTDGLNRLPPPPASSGNES
jgi:microcompartment protein CcmL/EutN